MIEVQLIQSLFIDFKKAEHKVYDFTRAIHEYSVYLRRNQDKKVLLDTLINTNEQEKLKEISIQIVKTSLYDLHEVKTLADCYIESKIFAEKMSNNEFMNLIKENKYISK